MSLSRISHPFSTFHSLEKNGAYFEIHSLINYEITSQFGARPVFARTRLQLESLFHGIGKDRKPFTEKNPKAAKTESSQIRSPRIFAQNPKNLSSKCSLCLYKIEECSRLRSKKDKKETHQLLTRIITN